MVDSAIVASGPYLKGASQAHALGAAAKEIAFNCSIEQSRRRGRGQTHSQGAKVSMQSISSPTVLRAVCRPPGRLC